VSTFDKNGNPSPDVWSGLQPGEFALAIDPSVVILYERTRADYFCMRVVETDEILVNLDLFDIVESEHL
jgi:predicted pyridoxine 5'-phosphate oxidase superfamily flavin-nucleotide-binding protein